MHSQTAKLIARISENLPDMSGKLMQRWIDDPTGLKQTLKNSLVQLGKPDTSMVVPGDVIPDINWQATYRELDLPALVMPPPPDDAHWNIPVREGLTMNHLIATLRRLGITCDLYIADLDEDVQVNDRHPQNGAYTVTVRRRVEADEENKNLSANQLQASGHTGLTLLEYLLLFLGYQVTTKKFLDEKNWTLCAGSRDSGGCVPRADWRPGIREFCVDWSSPDRRGGCLRSRSAVSV